MDKQKGEELLRRYRDGLCTAEEQAAVEAWIEEEVRLGTWDKSESEKAEFSELLKNRIDAERLAESGHIKLRPQADTDWVMTAYEADQVLSATKATRVRIVPATKWLRAMAAAAAIVFIALGIYFFNANHHAETSRALLANDIAPGKVGATLTLANGKKIRLADAAHGEIAKEAGISVTKTADGQIIYEIASQDRNDDNDPSLRGTKQSYNTLSTAKGETYILTLPDKSKVWLNAASSLTYSASLNERGLRRVRLEGEGYFEIAKDKAHPFIVETKGQQVEVLGTHFNVNAYGDDADVRTTLLEGSVKVNENTVLKPGQQSVLYDHKVRVQQVNTEDAVAWKNGLFVFEDEPLQSIMRKVERWYNVEVVYQGVDKNKLFFGSMSRYDNVSKVLEGLELTKGVHFKIEGRKIIAMK